VPALPIQSWTCQLLLRSGGATQTPVPVRGKVFNWRARLVARHPTPRCRLAFPGLGKGRRPGGREPRARLCVLGGGVRGENAPMGVPRGLGAVAGWQRVSRGSARTEGQGTLTGTSPQLHTGCRGGAAMVANERPVATLTFSARRLAATP
jgi:hypothetical protein